MSPDSISFSTVALAIFVVCAGFVLLRGTIRILLGCVVLCLSIWVGFQVWLLAPDLLRAVFGVHLQWLAGVMPCIAFLITFLLGRLLAKFLCSPFQRPADQRPPLTLARLLGIGAFTLIPTCLLVTVAGIVIYHAGAVAEIQQTAGKSQLSAAEDLARNLKASMVKFIPVAWLGKLDPMTDPSRLELAKAITRESKSKKKAEIDPQTGQAIPRAIIVDDPELQNLAREGKFSTLLRHPLLTKALNDPKLKAFLKDLNL